jgi:hypothetical protein
VLDLPTGNVIVALGPQEIDFLLQPTTGDKVPYFSPENAERIARALDDAGQLEMLPRVLLGAAMRRANGSRPASGPQGQHPPELVESSCDLVLDVRDVRVHVTMEEGPAGHLLHPVSGERFVRFSVETGSRIFDALSAAGVERDVIAKTLVGLRRRAPGRGSLPSTESPDHPQPDPGPPCGECADYKRLCGEICCGAGAGCTWCTYC